MMSNIKSTLIAKCRKEWEITIFGVCSATLIICVSLGVLVVSGWWEKDPPLRPPVPKVPDPFDKGAFAFLEEDEPPIMTRDHAFRVRANAKVAPPIVPPPPEEPDIVVVVPPFEHVKPTFVPPIPPPPKPPPQKEPPPPPPKTFVTYKGYMRTGSGQLRALVRVEDEEAGTKRTMYLPIGGILKDAKIRKFNDDTLILRTADGKTVTIPIKYRFEL